MISIAPDIARRLPGIRLAALLLDGVDPSPSPPDFLAEVEAAAAALQAQHTPETIGAWPAVAGWRQAMKACGEDPTRYRTSGEALLRRILQGKGLFYINRIVEGNNLSSFSTGLPIGLYDTSAVEGELTLRLARPGESYLRLDGREVDWSGKPCLSDGRGIIGSPCVDSDRTKTRPETRRVLQVIYFPPGFRDHEDARERVAEIMVRFTGGRLV